MTTDTRQRISVKYSKRRISEISSNRQVIPIISIHEQTVAYRNIFLDGYTLLSDWMHQGSGLSRMVLLHVVFDILSAIAEVDALSHGNMGTGNIFVKQIGDRVHVVLGPWGERTSPPDEMSNFAHVVMELALASHAGYILDGVIDRAVSGDATWNDLKSDPVFDAVDRVPFFPISENIDLSRLCNDLRTAFRKPVSEPLIRPPSVHAINRRKTLSSLKEITINDADEVDTDDEFTSLPDESQYQRSFIPGFVRKTVGFIFSKFGKNRRRSLI